MKETLSKNLTETAQFAREFLEELSPRKDSATVIGLYGDLGSGKTTFVQQVAKALGVSGSVQSPTFVIMKRYKITSPQPPLKGGASAHSSIEGGVPTLVGTEDVFFRNLIHIDAYRLESGEDLRKLDFETLLTDPKNLVLIEWADRVADILPNDHLKLHFEFVDDITRKIALQ